MQDACKRESPLEACGLIAGGVCYELKNRATTPGTFFIAAEDIVTIATRHSGYDGVWHTHPSGNPLPSEDDWAYHPMGKALIVATRDEVGIFYAEGDSTE